MSVRGMGRRSARPPYNILWATLAAAETIWSGFGIRSMARSYQPVGSGRQRSRPVSYVQAAFHPRRAAVTGQSLNLDRPQLLAVRQVGVVEHLEEPAGPALHVVLGDRLA